MPFPVLFVVPAVAIAGVAGAGKTAKGVYDSGRARRITDEANMSMDVAKAILENARDACGTSLQRLGDEKLFVLDHSVGRFIESFEKIKNLDLVESLGLEELRKFHIDKNDFEELKGLHEFAVDLAAGAGAGAAGGALTAFGAYSAATNLAAASTGTAIASLNGAAATNATLAFFGGGSLATGGLGIAGGTMVLGGLVAGPALLVMGLIVGKKADEQLEIAMSNAAQAAEICVELNNATFQCDAIRRRTYMFYTFLARLDARFLPLVMKLEDVIVDEGVDYSKYSPEAKRVVLQSATLAGTIKAILDTPILTEEGALTDESLRLTESLAVTFEGTSSNEAVEK